MSLWNAFTLEIVIPHIYESDRSPKLSLPWFIATLNPADNLYSVLVKSLEWLGTESSSEQNSRYPDQEEAKGQEEFLGQPISKIDEGVDNPIGELQELCQKQRISLPSVRE